MVWLKIVILVMFTIVLTKCLVIDDPKRVTLSVTSNSNNSKPVGSHLLTSVYDAMKYNHKVQLTDEHVVDANLGRIGPPVLMPLDNRNKRNTNNIERSNYYYTNPRETYTYNGGDGEEEQFIPKPNMCQNRRLANENDYSVSITEGMSSFSSVAAIVGKILFGLTAVLVLPLLILKALLIPIKILLGIKTFTVVNSLFFGAMMWRLLRNMQNSDDVQDDEDVDLSITVPNLSNINQINSDYGEIGLHDVERLLKYVKEKDKDW